MALSNDLISQFVKVNKDETKTKKETTVYATVVKNGSSTYVKIDGSELLTPVMETADTKDGERVIVMIKNHSAIITGNISSPAARVADVGDVTELSNKISEFEIVIADKVSTENFDAEKARIDDLQADNLTIKESLTATEADIEILKAHNLEVDNTLTANAADISKLKTEKLDAAIADITYASIEDLKATNADVNTLSSTYADFVKTTTDKLTANEASINDLETNKLDSYTASITYATIAKLDTLDANVTNLEGTFSEFKTSVTDKLVANDASISDLKTNKLSASDIEGKYANIDFSNIGKAAMEYFYAESGLIKDVVVGDTAITGQLVGVTISGDLIEGNTVIAEKLVIKGSDGLYYKLNTDGVTTEAEQTDENSLNGQIIKAKSITATKISVDDLVAFGATIGGFKITDSSIYSGIKESATNTTRGIYLNNDGEASFGDATNFMRYYKDQNGVYKLEISADSITFGTSKTSVETAIATAQSTADDAKTDISALTTRMSIAETTISQHTDDISLRATKTEVSTAKSEAISAASSDATTKANNAKSDAISTAASDATTKANNALASAKSYADAQIKVSADSISSTVATVKSTADSALSTANSAQKQRYHAASGESGTAGYVAIAQFTINNSYMNSPIIFGLSNLGQQSSNVSVCFKSVNNKDPDLLHIQSDGGMKVWAYKTGTSVWQLIVQKSEGWDEIYVNDFSNPRNGISVEWINVLYTELPTENITATTVLAAKITKATIDDLGTRVISAESSITQLSDRITSNVTETTNLGTRMTTVEQTATSLTTRITNAESDIDTAQSTANTAKTNAANATKTATNFLSYDSTNGLLVGNKSSGSWSGTRAQITSNSFNILDQNGTTLASYGTTTMIGKTSGNNVYIDSDSIDIRRNGKVLAAFDQYGLKITNTNDSSGSLGSGSTKPALVIGTETGYHIEIDNNEIMAKSNATTSSHLFLNMEGGNVSFNNNANRAMMFQEGALYAKNASFNNGAYLGILDAINDNGNTTLGYGGYDNSIGSTNIYGNSIGLYSNGNIDVEASWINCRSIAPNEHATYALGIYGEKGWSNIYLGKGDNKTNALHIISGSSTYLLCGVNSSGQYVFGNNAAIMYYHAKDVGTDNTGNAFKFTSGNNTASNNTNSVWLFGAADETSRYIGSYMAYSRTYSSSANMYVTANGVFGRSTSSSKRYKHSIESADISELDGLYNLPIKKFKYNSDYIAKDDELYDKYLYGFIAEDLEDVLPCAVEHIEDENGNSIPEMWNSNIIIPALLKLIQDLNDRVKTLEKTTFEVDSEGNLYHVSVD